MPVSIDGVTFSFDGGIRTVSVPPIAKASILILDKMIENLGNRQIIVFPERQQSALVFALARVIHNVSVGKIEKNYNPENFILGEKLKLKNAVVEYRGIKDIDGKKCLMLHMSDLEYSAPISMLPMLQRTDTNRPTSKFEKYIAEKKKLSEKHQINDYDNDQVSTLMEYKTHMVNSIYYVSSVASVKDQMSSLRICGNKASNLLLMGQTNYEGKITNIGTGQLAGIPAIVLSSDLYAVNNSLEHGNTAQSIIVDISNSNQILSQLDALDELNRKKIPVVFVTDTANSFDFDLFVKRGFIIWRWNESSLTPELYELSNTIANKRIGNCARQKLKYINLEGKEIDESAKLLAKHRKDSQEQSAQIMNLYEKLSRISFGVIRKAIPLGEIECNLVHKTIEECQNILLHERAFITEESYKDYNRVIENYRKVHTMGYILQKHNALCEVLHNNNHKKITIVIPEMTDKVYIENFWKTWIQKHMLRINLSVCFPTEYYGDISTLSDMTIITGWLRRAIMKKIIFSYSTESYTILLYDYENRWKNYDSEKWSRSLKYSNNTEIIQRSLSNEHIEISSSKYLVETQIEINEINEINEEDELEEINLILRENKYKQFVSKDKNLGETVEAIPISFVGGFLAFYLLGHKLISATKIIMSNEDKIENVLPENISIGDFIVVRESGRDIVKDMADVLLENSNKSNLRGIASKWREVLKIELLFTTEDDFFRKMAEAGCKKEIATIKNWIEDEDMIAPRSKEDLKYIADVTGSDVLKELLDEVFDAANTVRNSHNRAGRILSNQLKLKLVDVLKNYGDIDPYNFWEPIEMEVENIGTVKILKIIDKGNRVDIDLSDTNRLIEE